MKRWSLFFFLASSLYLQADTLPEDGNLREACRKRVAGQYLDFLDRVNASGNFIRSSEIELEKLQRRRVLLEARRNELDQEFRKSSYSTEVAAELESAQQELAMVLQVEKDHQQAIAQEKDSLKGLQDKIDSMKKAMLRVFAIIPIPKAKGPYPFRIDYLRQCERFRASCPLTSQEARDLAAVFAVSSVPLACERYMGYLRK